MPLPAYRVASKYYIDLIPLLSAIDTYLERGKLMRLAIDGPCASGKSTLGATLGRIYRCPLVHMDDFFLHPEQRTPERLTLPGENVDYERFFQEILSPLMAGKSAQYRP